ncbi:MAG: type III-B CRISPR module-associated protein Cmr5 [Sphingobacteriales bacterium]|nr:MAG: type III-B CRISPR module-associated protein Cmr5 [Sphingobacteriales bacterium]
MPNITTCRGIEQKRADYAFECALEAKNSTDSPLQIGNDFYKSKNYKSYAKKIPMLVKSNGLGASFAFILSKKGKEKRENNQTFAPGTQRNPKNAYDLIYKQTSDWINSKYSFTGDFSEFIITRNSNEYRTITNEVIALFTWLRRFAEGLIEGEEEQED